MKQAKDYNAHWDEKFRTRRWGRYPPEDLVRFIGRTYADEDRGNISVLEVGCGPGANLWFLHREGFRVSGIDISPAAIEFAAGRLEIENKGLNPFPFDLKVGDFSKLPWPDQSFDLVIDIFALYANTLDVIQAAANEVHRVLKPGGHFYSKLWGENTTGFGKGHEVEPGTYEGIPHGPCAGMGVSHFFNREEISRVFGNFDLAAVDVVARTDVLRSMAVEEYLCQFRKAG